MATKKVNKKVIIPIDEGETFVSLSMSKNMGENDSVAIEDKLHSLYNLQRIDSKIDKIYLQRGELPIEVQDIEDEVEGLKTRIANAKADIRQAQETISRKQTLIEESKELLAKYVAQRDNVKNNREYTSITNEIDYQELQVLTCEKSIRELKLFIEEKEELITKTGEDLKAREENLEEKRKELEVIIKETATEEAALPKERELYTANLDERMMIAYNKVRGSTRNKLAVVTVERNACGGCFNNIPPQRQIDINSNKKIIVCEYCGRILVSSRFAAEASGQEA